MKTLTNLKSEYRKGNIKKAVYINKMYNIHSVLFEYADFIKDTDISRIEVTDDALIMTTRQSGARFFCAETDKRIAPIEILNFGSYEPYELNLLLKLIKSDAFIFDIGANIGWYSINIAKLKPETRIYAFEPIPKTFSYLKRNIALNNISNVKPYNFGLSNIQKKQVFYYYPEGSGNASSVNLTGSKQIMKISGRVKKMDDVVREQRCHVDVIKCDVEGAELSVLQGALETIKRDRPIILMEILRKWSRKFHYNPNNILNLLYSIGYKCYAINQKAVKKFTEMNGNTKETNFIFLHEVNHAGQIKQLPGR
jgi:FkbM family methyltransferase